MFSISNALPIQFWTNGQQVFNEKVEPGMDRKPYFHPVNADDVQRIQFTDTVERTYKLTIFNCDDEEVEQLDFDVELVEGLYVYSLSFTFEQAGIEITNEGVWLQISYFEYQNNISGTVPNIMQQVSGELTSIPPSEVFEISGEIENLMQEVSGNVNISVELGLSNNSLDIQITDVWVDGVAATLTSGSLPLGTGSGATMSTKQTGSSQSIQVFYTSTVPDQHITVTDSNGNIFCQSSNSGSPLIFSGCVVLPGFPISIDAADGNCPP